MSNLLMNASSFSQMQLYSCSSLRAIVIIKDEKKGTKVNCNAAALIYSLGEGHEVHGTVFLVVKSKALAVLSP